MDSNSKAQSCLFFVSFFNADSAYGLCSLNHSIQLYLLRIYICACSVFCLFVPLLLLLLLYVCIKKLFIYPFCITLNVHFERMHRHTHTPTKSRNGRARNTYTYCSVLCCVLFQHNNHLANYNMYVSCNTSNDTLMEFYQFFACFFHFPLLFSRSCSPFCYPCAHFNRSCPLSFVLSFFVFSIYIFGKHTLKNSG